MAPLLDRFLEWARHEPVRATLAIRSVLMIGVLAGVLTEEWVAALIAPVAIVLDVQLSKLVRDDVTPSAHLGE